ncbi:MAG: glycoside hydrolase family 5 protein, partial [Bacteroidota bacterium]
MKKKITATFVFTLIIISVSAQGFLHTDGKYIYNGDGEEVILRGIGTGNWMLQEGYMMQTSDIAGTQHEFRARLEETIGEAKTDSFYNAWLQYHFTRTDVDSMKSWGYNSVRVAMHYKWFTPPIEEEPVEGEISWRQKGFELLDSALKWCADNQMYLILDLHGAPGGQGEDSNISDYDPSKPSLWESDLNKDKTVALWKKLAERYSEEPWIGGYDLINETNWTFPEGNNKPMRELYGRITDAIREVDPNHIIFIEGNAFANDFSDLTPPWDDNMVYSFHKYWNYNNPGALDWVLSMRDTYDIPIWLGETGENSNTWFTNLIALCEKNHIGWSWWPVKKPGINNPLRVKVNDSYTQLIDYWKGEGPAMTEEEAFQAVL